MTAVRRRILVLLALALQPACTSWQPMELPVPLDSTFGVSGKVRLIDASGVRHRTIYGASAVGTHARFRRPDWSIDSIPLSSIVRVDESRGDAGATVGAVILTGVSLFVGFFVVACLTDPWLC